MIQTQNNIDNPLVSVIIPTYKRPDNLKKAIDSVLTQTYSPIEIIIVDDNGKGTEWQLYTEKKLNEYIKYGKITYLTHDINRNGSAARNTGLRASHGFYINFLDDDDEFLPLKIEKQVACMGNRTSDFGACICNRVTKGRKRNSTTKNNKEGYIIQELLSGKFGFNSSCVLFRRDALEKINGFDESFWRHQDWELYVRFFRHYKMALVNDILYIKNYYPNILTGNALKAIEYKEKFLRTYSNDIEKMPLKNKIYQFQYESLALTLISQKYKKEGMSFIVKAFHFGIPSLWVCGKYLYYMLK